MGLTLTEYNIFLLALLAIFSMVATVMGIATVFNAVRLRNVRLSWRDGTLWGYPLFSTVFMAFSAGLLSFSFLYGSRIELLIFLLYTWMGGGWFLTSYLTTKRYITDNGIVKNINEPSQTIPWYQIRDFVTQQKKNDVVYVFLYKVSRLSQNDRIVRLELKVPERHEESFKKLISHKLGRQVNCYESVQFDVGQFDLD